MKHPNTPTKNEILDDLAGTYYVVMGEKNPGYASDYDDEPGHATRLVMIKELFKRCYPSEALTIFLKDTPTPPDDYHGLARAVGKAMDKYYKDQWHTLFANTPLCVSFDSGFIPAIIKGKKTQTRRFEQKPFSVGDLLCVRTGPDMKWYDAPCILRVVDMPDDCETMHTYSAMTDEWAVASGFEHRDAFFDWMQKRYEGKVEITGETWLHAFAFELVAIHPEYKEKDYE